MTYIAREDALTLLKKYNKDPFHIQHALTVEAVMRWYAKELGYGDAEEYWGIVGLLHDIDFELYPEEHCLKAPGLLREGGVGEDIIHAVVSHGYGITVGGVTLDVAPEHEMEKVLFAADELTGLIGALLAQRPEEPYRMARLGVFLHGLAGEVGGAGLIADDLPGLFPGIFRRLVSGGTAV